MAARVVMNEAGAIMAICTGSDACAEHEQGSAPLMAALTGKGAQGKREVAKVVKARGPQAMPDLMQMRRITENLSRIVFVEGATEFGASAVVGFRAGREDPGWADRLLTHGELRQWRQKDIVQGAWCESAFALRVNGEQLVTKLRAFAQGLRSGQGIFCGTFMEYEQGQRMAGVCVALEPLLTAAHRNAMVKAQAEFEAGVRLEVLSKADELMEMYRVKHGGNGRIGYVWAVWKGGEVDGDVVYQVNPAYGLKVPGGLDYDGLAAWIASSRKAA
jgi:hypothetical protein